MIKAQKNCLKTINTESLRENHNEFIKNNKLILKTQQRLKRKRHSVLPENINKIALSPKDDKKIWSINSVETYAYGTGKNLICKKNPKN